MGTAVVHSWLQNCCHFSAPDLGRGTSPPRARDVIAWRCDVIAWRCDAIVPPEGQHWPKLRFTPAVPTVAVPKRGSGQPWRLAPHLSRCSPALRVSSVPTPLPGLVG